LESGDLGRLTGIAADERVGRPSGSLSPSPLNGRIVSQTRMLLFRPVGEKELRLIAAARFRAFPPRLEHQPIFYPVLEREYAVQIARDWNTKDEASGYAGWVTEFDLDDEFARRYPVHVAGGSQHREFWVPADELEEFNRHIMGTIRVTEGFVGPAFAGTLDLASRLPSDLDSDGAG
jgi:hypothetical protein